VPYRAPVDSPAASVIVPARNSRRDLAALLDALRRQTLPRNEFEVIVGDDGSTDGTPHALASDAPWVHVVSGPPVTSYSARNRAVTAARAPVLAFIDADCVPEPDWLEQGLRALDTTDLAAGRIRFFPPEPRTTWSLIEMDGTKNHEVQVRNDNAETANLFVRRAVFDRVGGFDPTIASHGDFDFVERCIADGASLGYAPDVVVWHPVRSDARTIVRRIWVQNRAYAERATRKGERPEGLKLRNLVPVVQTYRARRRWGNSAWLDRRWLAANDIQPTRLELIGALPLIYLVVPYLRVVAQAQGWRIGRRWRSN
jgi:GT2 family glycosyltransferase